MTDLTAVPPQLTVVSGSARLGDRQRATAEDGVLVRLAIWLAEVSAETTLEPAASDAEDPAVEPMG